MKRMLSVSAPLLAVGLTLAACNQTTSGGGAVVVTPTPTPISGTISKVQEIIIDIREHTEKVCSFVPAESFLIDMLARVSYVGDALEYARAICAAVLEPLPRNAALARRRGNSSVVVVLPTRINGVQIRGVFVR